MKTRMNSLGSRSRSENLLRTLVGVSVLSSSIIALGSSSLFAAPPQGPNNENPGGLFKTYFENLADNECIGSDVLTGVDNTLGATYFTSKCNNVGRILGNLFSTAPARQPYEAVVGFDATTGSPTFGTVSGTGWGLYGNGGTTVGNNFIGTTDNVDLVVKTNGSERMRVKGDGNIGIGTPDPLGLLDMSNNGNARMIFNSAGNLYVGTMATNSVNTTRMIKVENDNTGVNASSAFWAKADGSQMFLYAHGRNNVSNLKGYGILYSVSDNGLAIYDNSANSKIDFFTTTNTSPKMRIVANGNIGIGTSNPQKKLDVAGEIVAQGRVSLTNYGILSTANSPTWHIDNSGDKFRVFRQPNLTTAGFETLVVKNNGYVGIGVTDPQFRFDVSGSIHTNNQLISTVGTGTAPLSVLSSTKVISLNADMLDGKDYAYFAPIDSPTFTGTPKSVTPVIWDYGTSIATTAFVKNQGYLSASGLSSTLDTNYIPKWNGSTLINSILYDNGTNIGIGMSPSGYKLDVNGSIRTNQGIEVQGTGNINRLQSHTIYVGSDTRLHDTFVTGNLEVSNRILTNNLLVNNSGSFNNLSASTFTANNITTNNTITIGQDARILRDTYVSRNLEVANRVLTNYLTVNNALTTASLHVTTNNIVADNNITAIKNVYANGIEASNNISAKGFIYTSDRRLKDNITPLRDSLDKILSLNGYSFDWKSNGIKDIGVIAQEVETVFPEIVHTDSITGYKSVEYGNLVAPLIEAIKEQQKEIDLLKAEVESLKKNAK